MNSRISFFLLLMFVILFTSCAQSFSLENCIDGEASGFWKGLWHGIIAPISFVLSLFKDNIAIYDVNNTGGWYDFGYVIGVGCLLGGGCKAKGKK